MARQYERSAGKVATSDTRYTPDAAMQADRGVAAKPRGWTVFSSVMLAMAAMFGMINGLIALIHDEVYLVNEDQIVALDFTQWGWVHLIGGGIVLAAALALLGGAVWARVIGVTVAFVQALSQVAFIEASPFWSLSIIALDGLVIYGCLVHGDDRDLAM